MARSGQTLTHPGTGETLTFRRTAADTGGRLLEMDFVVQPGGAPAAPHIHPRQVERFAIQRGRLRLFDSGRERVLEAGGSAEVAPGVAHTWQVEGDEPLEVTVTLEPALETERFFEEFFGLAQAGLVNSKGMPSPLRIAAILHGNPDVIYLARPSIRVQKALFGLLAPVARVLGVRRELDGLVHG